LGGDVENAMITAVDWQTLIQVRNDLADANNGQNRREGAPPF